MRRFWKNQAALNRGDPVALTSLPPELAEAARAQWEKALLLAQQTAKHDDNTARAHLEQLRRDNELRAHSFELREKEWELAARVRERALADAREHVNVLMKELATHRAELRARDVRIADLEAQLEECRQQLAALITRAVARNRTIKAQKPRRRSRVKRKNRAVTKGRPKSKRTRHRAKR
jgi:chromosome segregation ATPase